MSELVDIKECPNCGHKPFNTPYCPECGQRKLSEKDYRVSVLFNEFVNGWLNFENSFLNTFKAFLTRPKVYITEYVQGARKKYVSPIKLFILANAFYFIFPAVDTFKTTLHTQLNRLPYSEFTEGFITSFIASAGMSYSEFAPEYNELTQILSKALLIILPLVFSMVTWLCNLSKRNEKPLLYHINYSLVLNAFLVLFLCSVLPGSYKLIATYFEIDGMMELITEMSLSVTVLLILNVYGYFLYRNFFTGSVLTKGIKVILLNAAFVPLIQTYRLILLFVTLGWMKVFG
ncbi:DUF3667 domain-containing protein [Gracilimonas sp. BCB1]|uniref:DUF3667 domain-containing protein n=1 Tax=Gracilimonas sp. BCB1 TaxID=3152362 RepID=UPI0032D94EEF